MYHGPDKQSIDYFWFRESPQKIYTTPGTLIKYTIVMYRLELFSLSSSPLPSSYLHLKTCTYHHPYQPCILQGHVQNVVEVTRIWEMYHTGMNVCWHRSLPGSITQPKLVLISPHPWADLTDLSSPRDPSQQHTGVPIYSKRQMSNARGWKCKSNIIHYKWMKEGRKESWTFCLLWCVSYGGYPILHLPRISDGNMVSSLIHTRCYPIWITRLHSNLL